MCPINTWAKRSDANLLPSEQSVNCLNQLFQGELVLGVFMNPIIWCNLRSEVFSTCQTCLDVCVCVHTHKLRGLLCADRHPRLRNVCVVCLCLCVSVTKALCEETPQPFWTRNFATINTASSCSNQWIHTTFKTLYSQQWTASNK